MEQHIYPITGENDHILAHNHLKKGRNQRKKNMNFGLPDILFRNFNTQNLKTVMLYSTRNGIEENFVGNFF